MKPGILPNRTYLLIGVLKRIPILHRYLPEIDLLKFDNRLIKVHD